MTPTFMTLYLIGGATASLLGLLACAMLVHRFYQHRSLWWILLAYVVMGVGFDAVEWYVGMTHRSNFHIRAVHDVAQQLIACQLLVALNRRMGYRSSAWMVVVMAGVAVVSAAFEGMIPLRCVGGIMVFLATTLTLVNLYSWDVLQEQALCFTTEHMVLVGLLVHYASMAAMANWLHLAIDRGITILWASYLVVFIPEIITATCFIVASRARDHV